MYRQWQTKTSGSHKTNTIKTRAGIILTLIFISLGVILNVSVTHRLERHSYGSHHLSASHNTVGGGLLRYTEKTGGAPVMSSVNNPKAPERVLQYKDIAAHWSKQTGVPTALILAIIDQESDGRAEATRYEPGYKPSPTHKPAMDKAGVPVVVQKTSYGLMQMMFPVAWGYGARNTIELRTPHVAIRYGAAHIAALAKGLSKSPTWTPAFIREVAARYNGSKPTGKYATDVLKLYQKYQTECEA